MGDVDANKDNPDNLAFRIFNRLVLRDIALAEQQREAAIDLPFGDSRKCRAGAIKNGSDGAVAILFAQRRGTRIKSLPLRTNSVEMAPVRLRKSSESVLFSCNSVSPPFSRGTVRPLMVRLWLLSLFNGCGKRW